MQTKKLLPLEKLILKQAKLSTPIGTITVTASDTLIHSITLEPIDLLFSFPSKTNATSDKKDLPLCTVTKKSRLPIIEEALTQLCEYFDGKRKQFDLPLDFAQNYLPAEERPSSFRQKVWHALYSIPYGQTRSYAQIAKAVRNKNAVRAIGGANNANPFIIVVPCHRVINADGSLGGYGGGSIAKKYLLNLEQKNSECPNDTSLL